MRRFQIFPTVQDDYRSRKRERQGDAGFLRRRGERLHRGCGPLARRIRSGWPATPEPWQPWDCLAVFKVRHIMMGSFEGKLWVARLVRELGAERASRLFPGYRARPTVDSSAGRSLRRPNFRWNRRDFPRRRGGQPAQWSRCRQLIVGRSQASRTASGKPLLAGDPHRALDVPNAYYQNHIACPEFDAIGLSFPGCPGFPHFGHNAHVAWCVTHAMADYQDLYIEKIRSEMIRTFTTSRENLRRAEIRRGD